MVGEVPRRARDTDGDGLDVALLARIKDGDREAFRTLHARYYHRVLRFVYRVTGQLELAQEAVNDVMLAVWAGARSFAGRSAVSTWIMGIAYNRARKLLAQSRRWYERFKPFDDESIEPLEAGMAPTDGGDLRDLLDHGLKHLSAEQRAVVELTYFYGYSYEDIATIVDCPVNTVKTRMFYARAKLKRLLPALGKEDLS